MLAIPSLLIALSVTVMAPIPAQAATVDVFAGTGVDGYNGTNITATAAKVWNPAQIATDASGNVYFADQNNHIIRKIDTSGTISTYYGTAQTAKGALNGGLWQPRGVAVSASGTVYFSDSLNNVVRAGGSSIVAGNNCGAGGFGGDFGLANTPGPGGTGIPACTPIVSNPAKLNQPAGLAYDDTTSTLYIADQYNCRIRQVHNAYISTVAGNGTCGYAGDGGPATSAQLNYPQTVAVRNGKLYIADTNNNRIRAVDLATGYISTLAGTGTYDDTGNGGQASSAAVKAPKGVAVGAGGNVFIGTTAGNVRMVEATSGVISNVAGVLGSIQGMAIDRQGNIYVATGGLYQYLRKISGYMTVAPKYYGVLGDSYSAGQGNEPFLPPSWDDGCHRSVHAYAVLMESYPSGSGMSLTDGGFVACSGAVTSELINGKNGEPSQLNSITVNEQYIVLTIGGNDIGFVDYVKSCVNIFSSCDANSSAYADAEDKIADVLPGNLDTVYTAIANKISSVGGSARVLVLGYPKAISLPGDAQCEWLSGDEQSAARAVTNDLNSAISAAVDRTGAPFEYVPTEATIDNLRTGPFAGHELCTSDPYFYGLVPSNPGGIRITQTREVTRHTSNLSRNG